MPKKFDKKLAVIEETQYLSTLKVDELVGSLQTFEVAINEISEKKIKCVAFVSNTQENEDQNKKDSKEIFSDAIEFVRRKYNFFFEKIG